MTKGELDAYYQGSGEMMAALREILDGKDDGRGVANEPWESLRRRVLSLMQARAADPTSQPAEARCPEMLGDSGQCVKPAGHDGQHSLFYEDGTRPGWDPRRVTDPTSQPSAAPCATTPIPQPDACWFRYHDGSFCCRQERWDGHRYPDEFHAFVPRAADPTTEEPK